MSMANDNAINGNGVIGVASNIKTGSNPSFSYVDFISMYPQFGPDSNGATITPQPIVEMYINLADACVKESRWHSYWKVGMSLFIAHFCTLHIQGTADPDSGAAGVIKAGQTRGLATSKSVADVSVTTDYSTIAQSLDGWAAWKLTVYGQQLATIGRLVGKDGMYVY